MLSISIDHSCYHLKKSFTPPPFLKQEKKKNKQTKQKQKIKGPILFGWPPPLNPKPVPIPSLWLKFLRIGLILRTGRS